MCLSYYDVPDRYDAAVVCRELGYESAAPASSRPRNYTVYSHPLWAYLNCNGEEDSIYDCDKCCGQFYEGYSCDYVPEYACQSKLFHMYTYLITNLIVEFYHKN